MFQKKNRKVLFYFLTTCFLISCVVKNKEADRNEFDISSELKHKEWFGYIDSVYTYSIKNEKYIDSISLYFMKEDSPSVMAKSKYIFWKNAKSVRDGDFNLFIPLNSSRFLIVSNGGRNFVSNEIQIDSLKIKESKKVLLDLNNRDSFKDPCNQISKIEHKVVNQNIVFKIQIFQSCFDKYYYEQLNYPFP
jgi:hypothetical protein